MSINQFEALHQVRSATIDSLTAYEAAREDAQFRTDTLLAEVVAMHQRHAGELLNRQSALGYSTDGDSVDMVLKDLEDDARGASPDLVAHTERAVLDAYDAALKDWPTSHDPETYALLKRQSEEISIYT